MEFKSVEAALHVFGETPTQPHLREEAQQFILKLSPELSLPQLVNALEDDHFMVRWKAAELLAQVGCPALIEILKALVDPNRVGDSRLRNGAYHAIHVNQDPLVRKINAQLLKALHGSVPDLGTMVEAHHLLQELSGCTQR